MQCRSPAGSEESAREIFKRHVGPSVDRYYVDVLGNFIGKLNEKGERRTALIGGMDENGLMITHITPQGFIYFESIAPMDVSALVGHKVCISTDNDSVVGVIAKNMLQRNRDTDRSRLQDSSAYWIDIGVRSKDEALSRVKLGDIATFYENFSILNGSFAIGRSFDGKLGAYAAGEAVRRLARFKGRLLGGVDLIASCHRKLGSRGAKVAAWECQPQVAISIDAGYATDTPGVDNRIWGEVNLGGGPIIYRGAQSNDEVFSRLVATAKKFGIKHQISATGYPLKSDSSVAQLERGGCLTAALGIPVRQVNTPLEITALEDTELCIKLLTHYAIETQKA